MCLVQNRVSSAMADASAVKAQARDHFAALQAQIEEKRRSKVGRPALIVSPARITPLMTQHKQGHCDCASIGLQMVECLRNGYIGRQASVMLEGSRVCMLQAKQKEQELAFDAWVEKSAPPAPEAKVSKRGAVHPAQVRA